MRSVRSFACLALAATSACGGGAGGGTSECTRTLLDVHANAGTIEWTESGLDPSTLNVGAGSDECAAELVSTLDETDGSISTLLRVTCAFRQISFTSLVPDVRSLHAKGQVSSMMATLVASSGARTCNESLGDAVTWSVTSDAGDAAPTPAMVTPDYRRDFAFVAKATVNDGCLSATWSMNVLFSLEARSFSYGAETCLVPG